MPVEYDRSEPPPIEFGRSRSGELYTGRRRGGWRTQGDTRARAPNIRVAAMTSLVANLGAAARKVSNRTTREVVARVPMLRSRDEQRRHERRCAHAPNVPTLGAEDSLLVQKLRDGGVVMSSLDALALPDTTELRSVLSGIRVQLEDRAASGASTIRATNDEVADHAVVWRWGMSERLLDIVENYLGLPPRYYGAEVRCEVADTQTLDVRQWHRDVEDDRLFKILIWLNDVDIDGGPFEYVSRSATASATRDLSYVSGFLSDDRLASAVDRVNWQAGVGDAWTAAIADTASVFHRAKPPTLRNRYSATFTYSSWYPRKLYPKVPFTAAQTSRIRAGLSARQSSCLPDVVGN